MSALVLLAFVTAPVLVQDAAAPTLTQDDGGVKYDAALLDNCLSSAAAQGGFGSNVDPLLSCAGSASGPCMQQPGGNTTVGMAACMSEETKQWDMLLNTWYDKALKKAEAADAELKSTGSAAIPAAPVLRDAQRAWIAFRDKSCDYADVVYQGGTAGSVAAARCNLQLTAGQALRLKRSAEFGE